MHRLRSAVFDFCQATKSLSDMSEPQQIMTLQFELFHALDRANDFQQRSIDLESRVAELEAQVTGRDGRQSASQLPGTLAPEESAVH